MFLKEAPEESRKVKAATLLNQLKHRCAGMLMFFPDVKNFDQDEESNKQKSKCICKDIGEVPNVEHTKFLSSSMVFGSSQAVVRLTSFLLPKETEGHRRDLAGTSEGHL